MLVTTYVPASPATHTSIPETNTTSDGLTGYTSSMIDQTVSPQPPVGQYATTTPLLNLPITLHFNFYVDVKHWRGRNVISDSDYVIIHVYACAMYTFSCCVHNR